MQAERRGQACVGGVMCVGRPTHRMPQNRNIVGKSDIGREGEGNLYAIRSLSIDVPVTSTLVCVCLCACMWDDFIYLCVCDDFIYNLYI